MGRGVLTGSAKIRKARPRQTRSGQPRGALARNSVRKEEKRHYLRGEREGGGKCASARGWMKLPSEFEAAPRTRVVPILEKSSTRLR